MGPDMQALTTAVQGLITTMNTFIASVQALIPEIAAGTADEEEAATLTAAVAAAQTGLTAAQAALPAAPPAPAP